MWVSVTQMGSITRVGCLSHKWGRDCPSTGIGDFPRSGIFCHTYWAATEGCYIVEVTLHVGVTGHSTRRRTAHLVQETKAEKETKQEETAELW